MEPNGNGQHTPPANIAAAPVVQAAPATAEKPRKRSNRDFWRAMRFVWPYRRTIMTSVVCAFFVGLAVSGGLTTLTPIMRVLLNNQTIQHWADATIVEHRLGVRLLEESPEVQVVKVTEAGEASGIRAGDRIVVESVTHDGVATPGPGGGKPPAQTLDALAGDGRAGEANLTLRRGDQAVPARVALPALPMHLGALRTASRWVSADPVWAIAQIFVLLGLVATTGNVLKFFQEYLSDKVAVTAVNDVRRKVYDHILHVPMSHFGRHGTTDVTSRLVQDSMALEVGFKTVLGQSIQQPIVAGMAFAVAVWTSWQLTLVIVLFAPLMGAVIQKFGKKMRRAARGAMQKNASMLGQIEGTLAGVRVVKAAGAERWERRRYRGIMRGLVHEQLRMSRLEAAGSPIMETITLVCVGIIVLIATYMVTRSHSLSVTQFFLVMACLATIGDSLRRLNKVNGVLQRANAGAQRMFEVLALPVERRREGRGAEERGRGGEGANDKGRMTRDQGPGATRRLVRLKPIAREVRFEHITFTYPGAGAPALDDVSLTVPKGTCVAVVGRNGSGKTTLLTLLPRFYSPDAGRVTIDGVDVADATLRSLRGQIAVVTQDSVIFPGTIAENIAYGHPLAGQLRHKKDAPGVRQLRQEIEEAARRAFAHDFILEKPAGYDTVLDGLGGQLSGGQKQRLCIARAILRKAPILILDEATSQVDAENEHLIQQAIDRLLHEGHDPATGAPTSAAPTIFVIAHRFATIRSADVIVVMDRGRIVGQGTHDELQATCEVYRQLYERQLVAAPAA